jgi:hypothetical protein
MICGFYVMTLGNFRLAGTVLLASFMDALKPLVLALHSRARDCFRR